MGALERALDVHKVLPYHSIRRYALGRAYPCRLTSHVALPRGFNWWGLVVPDVLQCRLHLVARVLMNFNVKSHIVQMHQPDESMQHVPTFREEKDLLLIFYRISWVSDYHYSYNYS